MIMELVLVRHGETIENKRGIHQGHLPGTLSDLGRKQAAQTAQALAQESFDLAFSSPLGRAADTAAIILKEHPGLQLQFDDRLKEQFYGEEYQGKESMHFGWKNPPPSAEKGEQFHARVIDFLKHLMDAYPDKRILVVTHGGPIIVIKAFLFNIKLEPYCMPNPLNCSITRIRITDRKAEELVYNDTTHLSGR